MLLNKIRKKRVERIKLVQSHNLTVENSEVSQPTAKIIARVFIMLGYVNLIGNVIIGVYIIYLGVASQRLV